MDRTQNSIKINWPSGQKRINRPHVSSRTRTRTSVSWNFSFPLFFSSLEAVNCNFIVFLEFKRFLIIFSFAFPYTQIFSHLNFVFLCSFNLLILISKKTISSYFLVLSVFKNAFLIEILYSILVRTTLRMTRLIRYSENGDRCHAQITWQQQITAQQQSQEHQVK